MTLLLDTHAGISRDEGSGKGLSNDSGNKCAHRGSVGERMSMNENVTKC